MRPLVTLGPLTARGETGPNEQCIALYPLAAHYSIGSFPARVTFRPSEGPLFLGSFPAFGYLRPVTGLFCLWAKFSPWIQSARLWPVNLLGHFHSIIKYGLLMARYGQPIKRTISTLARLRPLIRLVQGP